MYFTLWIVLWEYTAVGGYLSLTLCQKFLMYISMLSSLYEQKYSATHGKYGHTEAIQNTKSAHMFGNKLTLRSQ